MLGTFIIRAIATHLRGVCVCVCVYVREREREREKGKEGERVGSLRRPLGYRMEDGWG
jgi:hypothetical protein